MTLQLAIAIILHQLATLIWVGGMFFAHFALGGSVSRLEPAARLPLMGAVLTRFFWWVWGAILVLWGSGLWIFLGIYDGSMRGHVHGMAALALVMTALFAYLYWVPFARLRAALAAEDWPTAAGALGLIRRIVLANLILGLVTAALGAAGRYW